MSREKLLAAALFLGVSIEAAAQKPTTISGETDLDPHYETFAAVNKVLGNVFISKNGVPYSHFVETPKFGGGGGVENGPELPDVIKKGLAVTKLLNPEGKAYFSMATQVAFDADTKLTESQKEAYEDAVNWIQGKLDQQEILKDLWKHLYYKNRTGIAKYLNPDAEFLKFLAENGYTELLQIIGNLQGAMFSRQANRDKSGPESHTVDGLPFGQNNIFDNYEWLGMLYVMMGNMDENGEFGEKALQGLLDFEGRAAEPYPMNEALLKIMKEVDEWVDTLPIAAKKEVKKKQPEGNKKAEANLIKMNFNEQVLPLIKKYNEKNPDEPYPPSLALINMAKELKAQGVIDSGSYLETIKGTPLEEGVDVVGGIPIEYKTIEKNPKNPLEALKVAFFERELHSWFQDLNLTFSSEEDSVMINYNGVPSPLPANLSDIQEIIVHEAHSGEDIIDEGKDTEKRPFLILEIRLRNGRVIAIPLYLPESQLLNDKPNPKEKLALGEPKDNFEANSEYSVLTYGEIVEKRKVIPVTYEKTTMNKFETMNKRLYLAPSGKYELRQSLEIGKDGVLYWNRINESTGKNDKTPLITVSSVKEVRISEEDVKWEVRLFDESGKKIYSLEH